MMWSDARPNSPRFSTPRKDEHDDNKYENNRRGDTYLSSLTVPRFLISTEFVAVLVSVFFTITVFVAGDRLWAKPSLSSYTQPPIPIQPETLLEMGNDFVRF